MLDILRAWLNGTREFYSGVMLYEKLQHNTKLLALFKTNGKTDWCYSKLQDELLNICNDLKANITPQQLATNDKLTQLTNSKPIISNEKDAAAKVQKEPANPELYAICKKEADLLYKQIMNQRALLFAEIKGTIFINVNPPDKIEERGKMAIDIVQSYQKVSELYDKADYVYQNGSLPPEYEVMDNQDKYTSLPDELVKPTLDNLRKNYNKKKKLPPTPERIASIQEHEDNIKKLEIRWHLLKPKQ